MRPAPSTADEATFPSRLAWLTELKKAELKQRGERGSQNEVAKFLEVDPGNFTRYLKGERAVDADILFRMAKKFRVDAQWLFTGQGVEGKVWRDDPTLSEQMAQLRKLMTETKKADSSPPPSTSRKTPQIPPPPPLPGHGDQRHLRPVGGRNRPKR